MPVTGTVIVASGLRRCQGSIVADAQPGLGGSSIGDHQPGGLTVEQLDVIGGARARDEPNIRRIGSAGQHEVVDAHPGGARFQTVERGERIRRFGLEPVGGREERLRRTGVGRATFVSLHRHRFGAHRRHEQRHGGDRCGGHCGGRGDRGQHAGSAEQDQRCTRPRGRRRGRQRGADSTRHDVATGVVGRLSAKAGIG